jgi:hypothetical protein
MTKPAIYYLISVLFLVICRSGFPEFTKAAKTYSTEIQLNPGDKQILLNGRIWRNQYTRVTGDQFFLADTFLRGSVTYNGRKFDNLDLKYDIFNDELILRIESHPIIFMNKEMVDSFSLFYRNMNYHIINAGKDTSSVLKGYFNVLYDGPSSLYVKYIKKIQPLAVDGKYDLFYQQHLVFLRKGAEIVPVAGKKKLMILLGDKKKEVRDYLKRIRFKVINKNPVTFIPMLEYYDSLRK